MPSSRPASGSAGSRITFFVSVLGWSGAETQLKHLAIELSERGHDVSIVAIEIASIDVAPLEAAGINVEVLGACGPLAKLFAIPKIARRAKKADVVHCTGWDASLWGRIGGALARKPVVVTEHTPGRTMQVAPTGAPRGRLIALHNCVLDRVTYATIAVAEWQIDLLRSEGVRESSIVYIPNAVPIEALRREAEHGVGREDMGLPNDAKVMVHVARFVAQKGQSTTVDAVSQLRKELGDVRVLFIGEGPEHSAVEEKAGELGGAAWASFLGHRDDVPALLRLADIAVLPSTGEGLPMSLIEAIAVGTPVVATDVGAVRWLLESTVGGICVPPGDAEAFTDACRRLLADETERARITTASDAGIQIFDVGRMTDAYESVLESAAAKSPLPLPCTDTSRARG